jgi:cytochrome c553
MTHADRIRDLMADQQVHPLLTDDDIAALRAAIEALERTPQTHQPQRRVDLGQHPKWSRS